MVKKKKSFNTDQFRCRFCSKKGHAVDFCPCTPNEKNFDDPVLDKWVQDFLEKDTQLSDTPPDDLGALKIALEREAARLNSGNPWRNSMLARDRLRQNIGAWKAIGASRTVLTWILKGVPVRFESEPDHLCFPNHASYFEHVSFVEEEVKQHLKDGSFVPIPWSKVKIVNPLQVDVNKKGKKRMIIDARAANAGQAATIFHLETLDKDLPNLLELGDLLITTDLKKAYYSVPLDDEAAPYFAFEHKGQFYAPRIIIFGECLAPFTFHKIMRESVRFLRGHGIRTMNYLDDNIWCMSKLRQGATVPFVKFFMPFLGFVYNDKCSWDPRAEANFLGLVINTIAFEFKVDADKMRELLDTATAFTRAATAQKPIQLDALQSFLGKLNAARLAIQPVGVWTRALYAEVAKAAAAGAPSVQPGAMAKAELKFWATELPMKNGYRIKAPEYEVIMYSDASEVGYGGHALGVEVFGPFPEHLIGLSSTVRELFGLCEVAEKLVKILRGKIVRVRMDSQCAVHILEKGGSGIHHTELSALAKQWWQWCEKYKVQPSYEWCPRELNRKADDLSKMFDREWFLSDVARSTVETKWGRTQLLSASDIKELAAGTTVSIQSRHMILLVPHFNVIAATLRLTRTLALRFVLVYPRWRSQSWWTVITQLAIETISLPKSRLSLSSDTVQCLPNWSMCASLFDFSCSHA